MTPRRAFCWLLALAVPVLLTGCAVGPVRMTIYGEQSTSETTGGTRRLNTTANKVGVSASCEFSKR